MPTSSLFDTARRACIRLVRREWRCPEYSSMRISRTGADHGNRYRRCWTGELRSYKTNPRKDRKPGTAGTWRKRATAWACLHLMLTLFSLSSQHKIELRSPHLLKDTKELWLDMIKRDIPRWSELKLPENPESWYDVYQELLEETRKEVEEDAQRMELALRGIYDTREQTSFVDPSKLPPPKGKRGAAGGSRLNNSKISKKSHLHFLRDKTLKKLSVPTHLLNKGFVPGRGINRPPVLDTSRKVVTQNPSPRANTSSPLVKGASTTIPAFRPSPVLPVQPPKVLPQKQSSPVSRSSSTQPNRATYTTSPKATATPLIRSSQPTPSTVIPKQKTVLSSSTASSKTSSTKSKPTSASPVVSGASQHTALKQSVPSRPSSTLPSSSSPSSSALRQKLSGSPSVSTKRQSSSKALEPHAHQTAITKRKRTDGPGTSKPSSPAKSKPNSPSKSQPSSGALLANLIQSEGLKSEKIGPVTQKPAVKR